MKRILQLTATIVLTAAFLVYALWEVDYEEIAALLAETRFVYLLPFAAALVVFFWLKARRWVLLLQPLGDFRTRDVVPAMMIGFAGNNLLPARLGEVVRILTFSRASGKPAAGVLASVALERLLDILAMLALFLLAMPFLETMDERLREAIYWIGAAVSLALVLVIALARAPGPVLELWRLGTRWLPERLHDGGRAMLESAIHTLGTVRSPARFARGFINSLAQWSLGSFLIWCSLGAMGVSMAAPVCVMVLFTTGVASAAPSAPGFVGAIQAAFVFALTPFGVDQEAAFAASVFYLLAQWVPVTAVGCGCFVWAMRGRGGWRSAFEDGSRST